MTRTFGWRKHYYLVERAIAEGPSCKCGHQRSDHATDMLFDGPCSAQPCEGCAGTGYVFPDGTYLPPDYDLLMR